MINLKFGFNFSFKRDKSVDKIVEEHDKELKSLREKEIAWEAKKALILKSLPRDLSTQ